MLDVKEISRLRQLSEGLTLLYVEDNPGLREKAYEILKKLFVDVISASDGQEGYELFKQYRPEIVITDIRMPRVDGFEMIARIRQIQPSTKFIITSAFDDKEYLIKAINSGVFRYIKKPVKVDDLTEVLIQCINLISIEDNGSLFNSYMEDMLNYQSDLLALTSNERPIFVNQMFLDFFDIKTIDEFDKKYSGLGSLFLPHKGFLYDHDDISWFYESSKEPNKLFHVKIKSQEGENKHFILKMHPLPKKKNTYILSLNDITDLNLLSLFDSKAVENDEKIKSKSTIINLMEIINKNSTEIKVHNFYKGLTITNLGLIAHMEGEHIVIKTSYMQQKAAQYQKSVLISSEIFPTAVLCEPIVRIDFENQTILLKEMHFLPKNPTQRQSVRVAPEEKHTVSLFFEKRKFYGDVQIHDISVEAVKLELNALPAGLKEGMPVAIDMVLDHDRKPMIINTPAKVLRTEERDRMFFIVLVLELSDAHKKLLIDYVARRQMILIREFKGLQFG